MAKSSEFLLKLWELRYKRAFEFLISKQEPNSKKIILDPNKREHGITTSFAREVISLAESEDQIPDPISAPDKNPAQSKARE